mmetsp:Transcript_25681/g.77124  ORF Transcript_25681/g.77124 Transcript_25681/m.77124 type:complete len:489 (-) Transcript_25681:67-1533(-)
MLDRVSCRLVLAAMLVRGLRSYAPRAHTRAAARAARWSRPRPAPAAGRRDLSAAATTLTRTTADIMPEEPRRSIDIFDTLPPIDIRLLDETWHEDRPGASHVIDLARGPPTSDPFSLVRDQLLPFSDNMKLLVASENPILSQAASHFFERRHGKRFRPTIVMLLARALPVEGVTREEAFATQTRLGQVTEMIHVASLIHDDVLDDADTRRGGDAIHKMYSNKVAVLSGDYLLARASVLLAKLGNMEVVQVMARALDSLVSGEIMQIKANGAADKKSRADGDESTNVPAGLPGQRRSFLDRAKAALSLGRDEGARARALAERDAEEMELYLRKSYYKTASLICDACRSCALLAGHGPRSDAAVAAEEYGYHLGLAFQIVDDVLDFAADDDALGKPAGADLSLGLATAPILFAAQDHPELRPLIERRFKGAGDVQAAYSLVRRSRGMALAMKLAGFHAQRAVDAVCRAAPHSDARDALISICYLVLSRDK